MRHLFIDYFWIELRNFSYISFEMTEPQRPKQTPGIADWLFKGVLTKVGDSVDRITGRRWTPSSSLATSELIERIKKLLDAESLQVAGKGTVVPHNIRLKVQWDKFATDSDTILENLRTELLTATIDHINDSTYYTLAPVDLKVSPDYFVEGVKLQAGFDRVIEDDRDVEMNVTVPALNVKDIDLPELKPIVTNARINVVFSTGGQIVEKAIEADQAGRISVGRGSQNLLTIKETSVSNIHATLVVDQDGNISVADTGSTNGTFVNEERIAYGKAVQLPTGSKVRFGTINVEISLLEKPTVVQPIVETHDEVKSDSMTIDGFEFRSRTAPENEPPAEIEPFEDTAKVEDIDNSDPKTIQKPGGEL